MIRCSTILLNGLIMTTAISTVMTQDYMLVRVVWSDVITPMRLYSTGKQLIIVHVVTADFDPS